MGEEFENTLKITKKNIQCTINAINFSLYFFILSLFLNAYLFALLQQFTACKNLNVASVSPVTSAFWQPCILFDSTIFETNTSPRNFQLLLWASMEIFWNYTIINYFW